MTQTSQTPGNNARARTALDLKSISGAVRKPTIVCPECKGKCVVYFYRTLDPYERRKSDDCEMCGGTGEVQAKRQYPPICENCDGTTKVFGTSDMNNDPWEAPSWGRCTECDDGYVPCGPACPCWVPGEGDTGSCSQDDPAEEYTFNRGGLSLWREGEL